MRFRILLGLLVLLFAGQAGADAAVSVDANPEKGARSTKGWIYELCTGETSTGICDLNVADNDVFVKLNRYLTGAVLYAEAAAGDTLSSAFICNLHETPTEPVADMSTDDADEAIPGATLTESNLRKDIEGAFQNGFVTCTTNAGDNEGVTIKLFVPKRI